MKTIEDNSESLQYEILEIKGDLKQILRAIGTINVSVGKLDERVDGLSKQVEKIGGNGNGKSPHK